MFTIIIMNSFSGSLHIKENRKEEREKKKNSIELQKPNIEAEVYNNSKKYA